MPPSSPPGNTAPDCGCGGSGYYLLAVPYGHPQWGKLQRCACGQAADRSAQAQAARQRLGDELCALTQCTFDSFDLDRPLAPLYALHGRYYRSLARVPMEQRAEARLISEEIQHNALAAAFHACQSYALLPRGWLCLFGAYGAGKSHLAAAICHVRVAASSAVRYRSTPGMLDALKAGFRDGSADAIFHDLLMCDLLVLDDLGSEHLSGWAYERLFRLFNERAERPTVITTNMRPDDMFTSGDVDAERLASRIAGQSRSVWLPIADYRRLRERAA